MHNWTVALSMLALSLAGVANAQDEDATSGAEDALQERELLPVRFTPEAGVILRLDSDLDGGGSVSQAGVAAGVAIQTQLNQRWTVGASANWSQTDYDFDGPTVFGATGPWSDIHAISIGANAQYVIDETWAVFGGVAAEFHRESGTDSGDGFSPGGFGGAVYTFEPGRSIGLGVGISDQAGDDVLFYPIISLQYRLTDRLRLQNGSVYAGPGRNGIELVYDIDDAWEVALGGTWVSRRFELDGVGVAPNGYGEHTRIPLWLRAQWTPTASITLDVYVGATIGGTLRLENSAGGFIAEDDLPFQAVIAGGLTVRF